MGWVTTVGLCKRMLRSRKWGLRKSAACQGRGTTAVRLLNTLTTGALPALSFSPPPVSLFYSQLLWLQVYCPLIFPLLDTLDTGALHALFSSPSPVSLSIASHTCYWALSALSFIPSRVPLALLATPPNVYCPPSLSLHRPSLFRRKNVFFSTVAFANQVEDAPHVQIEQPDGGGVQA